jgi:general secretion pathway protein B
MSLILEALRKMEQDRNSRRGAAQDIRPEVLRYRRAGQPQKNRPYLPWALGALLLAGVLGAGLFLKGGRETVVTQELAPPAPAGSVSVVAPDPTPPAAQPALPAPAAFPAPVVPVVAPQNPPRAETAPAEAPRPRPDRPPAAQLKARAQQQAVTAPVSHKEAAAPPVAAPDITVTGIAWQDERNLRRAVVNGSLVGEGAEVAGARVIEIREDRVRLSRGGQTIEAAFSSGLAPH